MGKKGGGRVRVKQVGPKMPATINPLADLAIPPEEMIHLPVQPDSNSGFLFWPMSETFIMTYDKFSAIYPNYLDSNKTTKLGRRIAVKDAVPEPTIQDIHEALVSLNIRHVIQPHKGYSRDATARWFNNGRVLVDLKGAAEKGVLGMGADGAFDLDDAIPELNDEDEQRKNGSGVSKKHLLRQLAHIISGLPGRQRRLEENARKALAEEAEKPQVAASNVAPAAGNRKKKGKRSKK
ncbi:hypothetical protein ACHAWX_001171 [Stephanocyclus meneghinianus]